MEKKPRRDPEIVRGLGSGDKARACRWIYRRNPMGEQQREAHKLELKDDGKDALCTEASSPSYIEDRI